MGDFWNLFHSPYLLLAYSDFLFLNDSVLISHMFLWINLFLLGFPLYWFIIVHGSLFMILYISVISIVTFLAFLILFTESSLFLVYTNVSHFCLLFNKPSLSLIDLCYLFLIPVSCIFALIYAISFLLLALQPWGFLLHMLFFLTWVQSSWSLLQLNCYLRWQIISEAIVIPEI